MIRTVREGSIYSSALTRRRRHERAVLFATIGYLLAHAARLLLTAVGLVGIDWRHWTIAFGATLVVQGSLFAWARWGPSLRWDPYFLYRSIVGAILLFSLFVPLLPEARAPILMMWLAVAMVAAGKLRFIQSFLINCTMAAGYVAGLAVVIRIKPDVPLDRRFETILVFSFVLVSVFEASVHARLYRRETERRRTRDLLRQSLDLHARAATRSTSIPISVVCWDTRRPIRGWM